MNIDKAIAWFVLLVIAFTIGMGMMWMTACCTNPLVIKHLIQGEAEVLENFVDDEYQGCGVRPQVTFSP